VIDALASLDLRLPRGGQGQRAELAAARKALRAAREPPAPLSMPIRGRQQQVAGEFSQG